MTDREELIKTIISGKLAFCDICVKDGEEANCEKCENERIANAIYDAGYHKERHGRWDYTINKGSCYDYSVTAKCSECGWNWISDDGIGNEHSVFGAFITNGTEQKEAAEMFLLENAKKCNKYICCPVCGVRMDGDTNG